MAEKDSTPPQPLRRVVVVMNEASGWPRVVEPTEQDLARLAEQAQRDLQEQREAEES